MRPDAPPEVHVEWGVVGAIVASYGESPMGQKREMVSCR